MPVVEKKACAYCPVDALAHLGAFALALPEARRALSELGADPDGEPTQTPLGSPRVARR
jgi:hypothetical protein